EQLPASSLILLADQLRREQLREEGVEVLQRARRRYPQDFWVYNVLSLHLHYTEPPRFREAARYSSAAAALRPESPLGWANLGAALTREGHPEEAIAALHEAQRIRPDFPPTTRLLAQCLLAAGKPDQAEEELREGLRLRPDSPMLRSELALLFEYRNKPD